MSSLMFSLAIGMAFARFGQVISWLFGAILVALTLIIAILINSINMSSLLLALSCVLAYNIGIMLVVTNSLFSKKLSE